MRKPYSGPGVGCPVCQSVGKVAMVFCDKRVIEGMACEDSLGSEADPHLHRKCQQCGYGWLEYPANAPESREREKPDCGFCGKDIASAKVMVAGPLCGICDECTVTAMASVKAAVDSVREKSNDDAVV